MGLDVWYLQDIHNALLAAEQANAAALEAVAVTDEATAAFRRGYRAALVTVALAFGLLDSAHYEQVPSFLEDLEWGEKLSISNRPRNRK